MSTLALEFSSPRRCVAVLPDGAGAGEARVVLTVSDEGSRSMPSLELVEAALAKAGVTPAEIECLVVGLGPGSYTGIRSAIALAQGWQLARPVSVLGFPTAHGLAAQAHGLGWLGRVYVVIDAQRQEFYFGGFEITLAGWCELAPLRLATLAEVTAVLDPPGGGEVRPPSSPMPAAAPPILIGPEVNRWFPSGRVLWPDAAVLGGLAGVRREARPEESLEPIYLRQTTFVKAPPPRVIAS